MDIPILYEDKDIVVISKPSGVMTHPDGRGNKETVSDWFAKNYPDSSEVGEPMRLVSGDIINRPGIVHRLDTDTSGVLVLAKNQDSYLFLKNIFKEHEAQKTYIAFVYGELSDTSGVINLPIGRSRKDFRLRSAQRMARGMLRDAITKYKVVSSIKTHSLVMLFPKTGRTHQIRVHLKAVHHPVVCDALYAPKHKCDLGLKRLGLHAYKLDIPMVSGGRMEFVADMPSDFSNAINKFPKADELLDSESESK